MGGAHHDEFDRERWGDSVADRTLYVTTGAVEPNDTNETGDRSPTECGLCAERVMPVTDEGTECCPICGFAVGQSDGRLRAVERIGTR